MMSIVEQIVGTAGWRRARKLDARAARYEIDLDRSIGKWDPDQAWIVVNKAVQGRWDVRRLTRQTAQAVGTSRARRL